ncbi:hypothetical protein [Halorubrum sp. LN27]|uniref:hypothetical protein n=1 Tax=Halorubrum sp. LN27 TaxID=2801032 RepID=UPI00190B4308|nr:hypothetical protein [Halorubrum sp. LN27]
MNRREYSAVVGASLVTSIAGCGGDGSNGTESDTSDSGANGEGQGTNGTGGADGSDDGTESEEEPSGLASFGTPADPQPTFEVENTDVDNQSTTLTAEFYGGAFTELVDGEQFWEPQSGEVFLLLQTHIENTGSEPYSFAGGTVIATDDAGNEAEWSVLIDGSRLSTEVPAGGEFNEWIVLVADSEATSFTLSIQPLEDIQVDASWNEDLEITFPEV